MGAEGVVTNAVRLTMAALVQMYMAPSNDIVEHLAICERLIDAIRGAADSGMGDISVAAEIALEDALDNLHRRGDLD